MMATSGTMVHNPIIYKSCPTIRPRIKLAALICHVPFVLIVNNDCRCNRSPTSSSSPGAQAQLRLGGPGAFHHLLGELFSGSSGST